MARPNRAKIIRWVSITILLTGLAVLVGVFFLKRDTDDPSSFLIESIPLEANLTISKIHQTATRKGVKEWSLDADSAQFFNARKQLVLNTIAMVFFMENNRQVHLSADRGTLATESKDVIVTGNIEVISEQNRLKTDELHYTYEERLLFGDVPVEIIGQSFNLKADRMSYDLKANRAVFEGNVRGFFSEDLPE